MGQYCKNCHKFMKNPEMTHCSDECLLEVIQGSTSLLKGGINAMWDERADPWT